MLYTVRAQCGSRVASCYVAHLVILSSVLVHKGGLLWSSQVPCGVVEFSAACCSVPAEGSVMHGV